MAEQEKSKSFKEIKAIVSFHLEAFDLESGPAATIKEHIAKVTEAIEKPALRGPLFALTHELAANGLKAIYKQLYYEFFVKELGFFEVEYTEWLTLFRSEIESHRTQNFERLARQQNLFIALDYICEEQYLLIRVENPGVPSEVESKRIQESMAMARKLKNMQYLFDPDSEDDSAEKEGAGLGLPLLIMTMRGLGIRPDNFALDVDGVTTIAEIRLPWSLLYENFDHGKVLVDRQNYAAEFVEKLGYHILVFDMSEKIIHTNIEFFEDGGVIEETLPRFKESISEKFFENIFRGTNSIRIREVFNNYRCKIASFDEGHDVYFNVSGFLSKDSKVVTLWQRINTVNVNLKEGDVEESLRLQNIIDKYLPKELLNEAESVAAGGGEMLPDKTVEASVMLIELSNLLDLESGEDPHLQLPFLNIALGIIFNNIKRRGGRVSKMAGKEFSCMFDDVNMAIQAGIEIMRQFADLNNFRRISGSLELSIKQSLHFGKVVIGSLGSDEHKERTLLGPALDTIRKMNNHNSKGNILISEDLILKTDLDLVIEKKGIYKSKKNGDMTVSLLTGIKLESGGKEMTLSIDQSHDV